LEDGPLSKKQVEVASRLLGKHWVTLYRLRKRFIMNPFAKTLARRKPGSIIGCRRLDRATDEVIDQTFVAWIAGGFHETHTRKDFGLEVRRNCLAACVHLPSFATVTRRWLDKKKRDAFALAEQGSASIAPGQFDVQHALDVVQVDHTQADVLLVDEVTRKVIGRPWLSLALDVATRSVLAVYVAMKRPNSSTVGLLLTRVVFPKSAWLAAIGVDTDCQCMGCQLRYTSTTPLNSKVGH